MSIETMKEWIIRDLCRHGSFENRIHEVSWSEDGVYRFKMYTEDYCYSISAKAPESEGTDKGYIGCIAICRKPHAGEDQFRGSDLADGEFSPETWHRVLADIVNYELVPLNICHGRPILDGGQEVLQAAA